MTPENLLSSRLWTRVPRCGSRCPQTGLSRTRLYRLLHTSGTGIKTVMLKSPGKEKGTRLIEVQSVLAYLDRLAAEQKEGGTA